MERAANNSCTFWRLACIGDKNALASMVKYADCCKSDILRLMAEPDLLENLELWNTWGK